MAILPLTLSALTVENKPARAVSSVAWLIEPECSVTSKRDHQVAARFQLTNCGVRVDLLHQVINGALPRQPPADANILTAEIVGTHQHNQPISPSGSQFPPKVTSCQRTRHLENDPLQLRSFTVGH